MPKQKVVFQTSCFWVLSFSNSVFIATPVSSIPLCFTWTNARSNWMSPSLIGSSGHSVIRWLWCEEQLFFCLSPIWQYITTQWNKSKEEENSHDFWAELSFTEFTKNFKCCIFNPAGFIVLKFDSAKFLDTCCCNLWLALFSAETECSVLFFSYSSVVSTPTSCAPTPISLLWLFKSSLMRNICA